MAAVNVLAGHLRGVIQVRTVSWKQRNILTALFQGVEGVQVIGQVTVRLRKENGVAAGDSVTRDNALEAGISYLPAPHKEAGGIRGMAWGVHDLETWGDAIEGDVLTILESLSTIAVARIEGADGGAGHLPQALCARSVVIMAVGNHNQSHLTCVAVHNVEMAFILRTRIHDDRPRVFSGANNPRIRTL